jgi:hypothetical protein
MCQSAFLLIALYFIAAPKMAADDQTRLEDRVIPVIEIQNTTVGGALETFASHLGIELTFSERAQHDRSRTLSFTAHDTTWSGAFNGFLIMQKLTLAKMGAHKFKVQELSE